MSDKSLGPSARPRPPIRNGDLRTATVKGRAATTRPAAPSAPTIGRALGRIIGRAAKKRGFHDGRLLEAWPEIVGPTIASLARPDRLSRRSGETTLILRAAHGPAAAQLQHVSPQILERINAYLGPPGVQRLKINQSHARPRKRRGGVVSPLRQAVRPRTASSDEAEIAIDDLELRAALTQLRQSVKSRR